LGGLALATPQAVRVLDASGKPWVLLETVGVGQVEVEVAANADTTMVVVNPGWGDAVQANKAGLMEVADVFVINKADRAGLQETRRDLQQMLELSSVTGERSGWQVPIVATVATSGDGIEELWDAVCRHREHAAGSGELERRRRFRRGEELREILARRLEARARELLSDTRWTALAEQVGAGDVDPWMAADEMLDGTGA
jgi:LAO/AO transport system kinase